MTATYISDELIQSTAASSSSGITVPSDCTLIVVALTGWKSYTGYLGTAPLFTIGGSGFTERARRDNNVGGTVLLETYNNPPTGSQTLAWAADAPPGEGFNIVVTYWKDADLSSLIIDAGTYYIGSSSGGGDLTGLTYAADSVTIGCVYNYASTPTVTDNGQTAIRQTTAKFGPSDGCRISVCYSVGTDGIYTTGGDYTTIAAIVIRSASSGALAEMTGVQTSGQVGTITISGGALAEMIGAQTSGQVGALTIDLTAGVTVDLVGVQALGQLGDLSISGHATATIIGVNAAGQIGVLAVTVDGAISVDLTGVSASGQVGDLSVAGGAQIVLDGVEAIGFAGNASVSIHALAELVGVSASALVGAIDITGSASVSFSGVYANGQAGTITINTGITNIDIPGYRVYKILHDNRVYLVLANDNSHIIH